MYLAKGHVGKVLICEQPSTLLGDVDSYLLGENTKPD